MTRREKRRAILVAAAALLLLLSFVVGPWSIVQLFRLRDLGTETEGDACEPLTPEALASIVVGTETPDWSRLDAYREYPTTDAARYRVFPLGRLSLEYYGDEARGVSQWTLCDGTSGDELDLTHGVSRMALELFLTEHP